jgi:hypothetical protein
MGRFLPADHSLGDANTVGGYHAVHSRPAGFEGKDGNSYSVEIITDDTGDPARPFAAYLMFVRWSAGDPVAAGHLETDFLEYGASEAEAAARVGAMRLNDARDILDKLIAGGAKSRPWWEVMREEDKGE